MNNWQSEFLAEYDRQRILQEVEQIRLEKLAAQPRPRLFARIMANIGNWMVGTGRKLTKRYEVPVAHGMSRSRETP
ncbi:MAG: hypothetical protein ACM33V_07535 [Chloroflexota bacterium]|nr:hypothetical protein [Anaerolineales bacterium]